MSKDQQAEAHPVHKNTGRLRLNVHVALAERRSEPHDPVEGGELLRKREERVKERLSKLLRRRYPPAKIPGLLAEFEAKLPSLEAREERVRLLETIPSSIWTLDRQIQKAVAQVQPLLEAAAEFSRVAPQLQDATEKIRLLHDARAQISAIEPQVEAAAKAVMDISSIAAKGIDSVAARNFESMATRTADSLAAKVPVSLAAESRDLLADSNPVATLQAGMDAFNAAREYLEGVPTMSRSILGDFNDRLYGYDSATREIARSLESRREIDKAMGLDPEIHRILGQEEDYRRALGLDSGHLEAMREILTSRDLLEAAFHPLPDLGRLSDISNTRDNRNSGALRRLNRAISNAPVLGKVEVQGERVDAKPAEAKEADRESESNLVKVVPAEVLTQIRLPLSELNRVLRHPEAMRTLNARDFEKFVATLVEQLGFEDVVLTPPSGDRGRDVLATRRVSGIPIFFAFECKRYAPDRPIGPDIARALLGTIMHGNTRASMGVLVTTSTFTPAAKEFIVTSPVLDGKDFDGILEWLKEYHSLRGSLQ